MNSQFEFKPNISRGNFCIAKLRNSRAQAYLTWACVSRLELDPFTQPHFLWQFDLLSFNQRLPNFYIKNYCLIELKTLLHWNTVGLVHTSN